MSRRFPATRQQQILEKLWTGSDVNVAAVAEEFGVSTETVRRDLKALERAGKLRRSYGGALPVEHGLSPLSRRIGEFAEAKDAVGQVAAQMVEEGQWVYFGSGSTALAAARRMAGGVALNVMTHMPAIADAFAAGTGHRIFLTGGEYDASHGILHGERVLDDVRERCFDLAVLGAHGIDLENGVVDGFEFLFRLNRLVLKRAERCIWLADSEKFGRKLHFCTAPFEAVETLVTDRPPPAEFEEALERAGVALVTPEVAGEAIRSRLHDVEQTTVKGRS